MHYYYYYYYCYYYCDVILIIVNQNIQKIMDLGCKHVSISSVVLLQLKSWTWDANMLCQLVSL